MFLKPFYLIFGIGLLAGAAFMYYKKMNGENDPSVDYAIILCLIVGSLCLFMYRWITKMLDKDDATNG